MKLAKRCVAFLLAISLLLNLSGCSTAMILPTIFSFGANMAASGADIEEIIEVLEEERKSEFTYSEEPLLENPRSTWNAGTNKVLEGTVMVYLLFIDDNTNKWNEVALNHYMEEEVYPTLRYLEKEAEKWGRDLHLVPRTVMQDLNEVYHCGGNFDSDPYAEPRYPYWDFVESLGYKSPTDWLEKMKTTHYMDEVIVVELFSMEGNSYTRYANYGEDGPTVSKPEYIRIFRLEEGEHEYRDWDINTCPNELARRILCLYGAYPINKTNLQGEVSDVLYPKDVMNHLWEDISQTEIGECTAYLLGWTDEIPEACYIEEFYR